MTEYNLLQQLCEIHAPSGDEKPMRDFLIHYFQDDKKNWKIKPELFYGDGFQDCLIVKFGNPKTAVFAHMDSIGYTARYENQLVPIGGPDAADGTRLKGHDSLGPISCKLKIEEKDGKKMLKHDFARPIQRGTSLTYECNFHESDEYIQSCYLDNRLGVFNCLKLAEDLENGLLVFSSWEEHGGGSVPFLLKWIMENHPVKYALVSDITWVTDGVQHGLGTAISMRDHSIPRQSFIRKIIDIAEESDIPYQLEVEGAGSSDGREVQHSPYPIDWCFIGAAEDNVHTAEEKVHKKDIESMVKLYRELLTALK